MLKRRSYSFAAALAAVVVLLAGCGALSGGQEKLRPPNYASPTGTDSWEVHCERNTVVVDNNSLEQFYRNDGSVKTYLEFCEEATPGPDRGAR